MANGSRSNDEQHMREALALAREGTALASPNPCVGAVVADAAGNVVGRGSYTYAGVKHAEVLALDQAGAKAGGGTLYVNLEPCCHQGRTGPCTEVVIASGIKRVVAAMRDPNPLVAGKGFELLRAAGVEVTEAVLHDEARKRNESFAKWIRTRLPLVTLKAAITLDGKIAPPPGGAQTGESQSPTALGSGGASTTYITSEAARAHVQELRHASDAILVGVGTIVADDPLLTDRTLRPRRRPLQRVILDSRLRVPLESRIVKTAKDDVIVFCSFAEEKKKQALESQGVRVEQVRLGAADGRPDLKQIAARLGELELISLLIEGGALVNWAALASGVVDKVFLYYAPRILAGTGSVPFAAGPGFRSLGEAPYVKQLELHRFGEDFAVEGYLRDPYEAS
ncbi:MAG: bifunctional diaminohydroxyphosphoribosylaminopyrimidine deaminase/5-amino-6-(5-phosphoribosylamino)uracil reductase RibD [Acidobacteriota bacterium]|nr:bifunctional diaminohydroxyphosphoribosylaminopyrimidine deaminase/5-amino-6-(5-phosphoribosylamino)uracil reductase RibD [Acidobacteriota bacterium]